MVSSFADFSHHLNICNNLMMDKKKNYGLEIKKAYILASGNPFVTNIELSL